MLAKLKNIFFLVTCLITFNQVHSQINEKQNEARVHNIVIQLNTADTASWSSVIGNIKNIQKVWATNLNIEVVVHGKAIDFLVKDKTYFTNEIQLLAEQGIKFLACQNTMRKHNIESDRIVNQAKIVPSGVVEIILKQEAGWSYLKSGL